MALARARSASVRGLQYELWLQVPTARDEPIHGRVRVRFEAAEAGPLVLDFAQDPACVLGVVANGLAVAAECSDEHLVVPATAIRPGRNELAVEFVAGDEALNRQDEFLYSLFVPARARLAFPCFDQPDLKAPFTLTLDLPATWTAVSNTPVDQESLASDRRHVRFRQTEPLPTYLFAFVAGRLECETVVRDDRTFRVWHREPRRDLVARNLSAIVDLHAASLAWVEDYTAVPYPFSQFDCVLVPSFQFSGMEHPGAILYNASRLLLEETATDRERVARAALVAHETAHIWFGDLVTMPWFDDVWLKEVFASFVAEKIVARLFPQQNHDLRFYLTNYPPAYALDRTAGATPIRQALENLQDAGRLYGPAIYQKAPAVFRQLERWLGEAAFRDGVRRYLEAHRFGCADWEGLLRHLAPDDTEALRAWSAPWVERAGRPRVTAWPTQDEHGTTWVRFRSEMPQGNEASVSAQELCVTVGYDDRMEHIPVQLRTTSAELRLGASPRFVLAGGRGLGYGEFPLDPASLEWLLEQAPALPDALTRGVVWTTFWDELLEGRLLPDAFLRTGMRALDVEDEAQNTEHLLGLLTQAFWRFLTSTEREAVSARLEETVLAGLRRAGALPLRAAWFAAYLAVVTTEAGCRWLEAVWAREEEVPGLVLSEADETAVALDLAVRSVPGADLILERQLARIDDGERRARFAFLRPAVSSRLHERVEAFEELLDVRARAREPWVVARLTYLNHPLRQAEARRFLRRGLEALPEIARTGDIFFPARWTEALLSGHGSSAALAIVDQFLAERTLEARLEAVVATSSDLLRRAVRTCDAL